MPIEQILYQNDDNKPDANEDIGKILGLKDEVIEKILKKQTVDPSNYIMNRPYK